MRRSIVGGIIVALLGLTVAHGAASRAQATDTDAFHGLTPARLLDTRSGGSTIDGVAAGIGALPGGSTMSLDVLGRGGVPGGGVGAVALNVTVDAPASGGYLTVSPADAPRPTASNLNFVAGQTVPNMVVVPVGVDGEIGIFNGGTGSTGVLVDVLGWFPQDGSFTGLTPSRVMDTRMGAPTIDGGAAGAGPLDGNSTTDLTVAGRGGVPSTGAGAVALNVTVDGAQAAGYLSVWPGGAPRPNASNVNFAVGRTVPNMVIVPIGADGKVSIFNGATSRVDVIVDVLGWFASGSSFTGLTPARLLDTRGGYNTVDTQFGGGQYLVEPDVAMNLLVAGRGGVPSVGIGAVAINVTVVNPTDDGYLSVYPLGVARPNASSLNFTAGQTVANLVIVPVGADGNIKLYLGGMTYTAADEGFKGTDVLVDVLGSFAGPPLSPDGFSQPVLKPLGLGAIPFGAPVTDTITGLQAVIGDGWTSSEEIFPVLLPNGMYVDPETDVAFPYPFHQSVCGALTCLSFGGPSYDNASFVGWSTSDERLVDAYGIGVGSRVEDHVDWIDADALGACGNSQLGSTPDGLAVASETQAFDVISGPVPYVVWQVSAGARPTYVGPPGC
jgi:hypothetical protein